MLDWLTDCLRNAYPLAHSLIDVSGWVDLRRVRPGKAGMGGGSNLCNWRHVRPPGRSAGRPGGHGLARQRLEGQEVLINRSTEQSKHLLA